MGKHINRWRTGAGIAATAAIGITLFAVGVTPAAADYGRGATYQVEITVNEGGRKVQRRPRKEYPNVMGMSIHEWLASREVAAVDPAGAAVRGQ